MRVLSVTPRCPAPPDTGGRKAVHGQLAGLVDAGHEVAILTGVDTGKGTEVRSGALAGLTAVWTVERAIRSGPGTMVRSLFSTRSYTVHRARLEEARTVLNRALAEFKPEVVQFEFLDFADLIPLVRERSAAVVVYRAQNVFHLQLRRMADCRVRLSPGRAALLWEARKARSLERNVSSAVDGVLTLTETDADVLRAVADDGRFRAVPPGVEIPVPPDRAGDEPTVVFLGTLSWMGNAPGVEWLVRDVWPRVRARRQARLVVAGHDPPGWLRRAADESLLVPGYLEDLSSLMRPDHVFVSPLKAGSGIRMKVLHAISCRMPVVATPMSVEGLALRNGPEILVRETAEGFAGAILRLLDDPEQGREMAGRAVEWLESEHSWSLAVERTERFYRDLVATPPSGRQGG